MLCCHSITKITRNDINGVMFVTLGERKCHLEKGNERGELERRHKESGRPRGKMEEKRGRNESTVGLGKRVN